MLPTLGFVNILLLLCSEWEMEVFVKVKAYDENPPSKPASWKAFLFKKPFVKNSQGGKKDELCLLKTDSCAEFDKRDISLVAKCPTGIGFFCECSIIRSGSGAAFFHH